MRLFISRKILITLSASFVIIVALTGLSYLFFSEILQLSQWGAHSRTVLLEAEQIKSLAGQLTNEKLIHSLSPFEEESHTLRDNLAEKLHALATLTKNNPKYLEEINRFDSISKVLNEKEIVPATVGESIQPIMREMYSSMEGIQAGENQVLLDRSIQASNRFRWFAIVMIGLMAFTLVLLAFLAIHLNTTLRKRAIAEEELRVAEQAAKKVNAELESFSYSVSHDLRAPLRIIDGYTKILKTDHGEVLNEDGHRVMDIVLRNVARMGQLIDDLLDFSRVGRTEVMRSTIVMGEFVEPILNELLSAENGRKIETNVHLPVSASIDTNLFRQVWINLLSNALKYSRKTEHTKIEVGFNPQDDNGVYYVKDNGVGFDMKYSSKLFSVFQRLHKESDFEGTGVGLALVKRIIERHDGKIWAESELNKGSTFYFTLPLTNALSI